jgi:hypothetical protein
VGSAFAKSESPKKRTLMPSLGLVLWGHESLDFLILFFCYFLFYQESDQGFGWKMFERVGQTVAKLGKKDRLRFLMRGVCYFLFYQGKEQGLYWKVV